MSLSTQFIGILGSFFLGLISINLWTLFNRVFYFVKFKVLRFFFELIFFFLVAASYFYFLLINNAGQKNIFFYIFFLLGAAVYYFYLNSIGIKYIEIVVDFFEKQFKKYVKTPLKKEIEKLKAKYKKNINLIKTKLHKRLTKKNSKII